MSVQAMTYAANEASAARRRLDELAHPWRRKWSPAPGQRARILKRDGHRCQACGATQDLVLDHVVPRRRGGPSIDDNLRALCRPCNSRKGAR